MHYTADFCHRQRACCLLNYLQSDCKRHWSIAPHTRFQRFALDEFHGIETLPVLFAIKSHPSDVGMVNVRSRARFAQKTRARAGILRHAAVDDLEGNSSVQDCIASAISYLHRSRTELDRETIGSYFHSEVAV